MSLPQTWPSLWPLCPKTCSISCQLTATGTQSTPGGSTLPKTMMRLFRWMESAKRPSTRWLRRRRRSCHASESLSTLRTPRNRLFSKSKAQMLKPKKVAKWATPLRLRHRRNWPSSEPSWLSASSRTSMRETGTSSSVTRLKLRLVRCRGLPKTSARLSRTTTTTSGRRISTRKQT